MVNDISFTEAASPEEELQVYSVSEHIVSHLQSPTVLENELFLDNMEKEARFVNFKNNIIAELTKIISEKIKIELKTFKTDSLKELSESLTWYKNETNVLKEECKSKDMIIAKLSKTIENLTNKKPEAISRDVQTNSNQPTKELPLWEIMSELSSNSDGIQEEVTESSNFKQPTEVTFSTPTVRSDNGKTALTVRNICSHLLDLNLDILDNRNITTKHLGRKGPHLNKTGSTRLAKNIIHKLRKF